MVERFRDVEEKTPLQEKIAVKLERHPHLRARIEGLLDIIDNAGDDIEKASVAEQRVMEELRGWGTRHCIVGPRIRSVRKQKNWNRAKLR